MPVTERRRFELAASLDYRFNATEDPRALRRNLRCRPAPIRKHAPWPSAGGTATIARRPSSARPWRCSPPSSPTRCNRRCSAATASTNSCSVTRRGFCEHYAAAFVVLMRAAGIPARVVTGYQGGEFNPLDGYLVVRQSDAHAWAEVWLAGQGWVRVDPTAAVSPTRIETGIADACPSANPARPDPVAQPTGCVPCVTAGKRSTMPGTSTSSATTRNASANCWPASACRNADWRSLATVLGIAAACSLPAMMAWALYQRPAIDPAFRLWHKALRHLARRQVDCAPWETPLAGPPRASNNARSSPPFQRVVDAYLQARYGTDNNLTALREAIAQLRQ
jgi:hypothetical protein